MKDYSIANDLVEIYDEGWVFIITNKSTGKRGSGRNHNENGAKYYANHYDGETAGVFVGKKKESIEYILKGLGLPKYNELVKSE